MVNKVIETYLRNHIDSSLGGVPSKMNALRTIAEDIRLGAEDTVLVNFKRVARSLNETIKDSELENLYYNALAENELLSLNKEEKTTNHLFDQPIMLNSSAIMSRRNSFPTLKELNTNSNLSVAEKKEIFEKAITILNEEESRFLGLAPAIKQAAILNVLKKETPKEISLVKIEDCIIAVKNSLDKTNLFDSNISTAFANLHGVALLGKMENDAAQSQKNSHLEKARNLFAAIHNKEDSDLIKETMSALSSVPGYNSIINKAGEITISANGQNQEKSTEKPHMKLNDATLERGRVKKAIAALEKKQAEVEQAAEQAIRNSPTSYRKGVVNFSDKMRNAFTALGGILHSPDKSSTSLAITLNDTLRSLLTLQVLDADQIQHIIADKNKALSTEEITSITPTLLAAINPVTEEALKTFEQKLGAFASSMKIINPKSNLAFVSSDSETDHANLVIKAYKEYQDLKYNFSATTWQGKKIADVIEPIGLSNFRLMYAQAVKTLTPPQQTPPQSNVNQSTENNADLESSPESPQHARTNTNRPPASPSTQTTQGWFSTPNSTSSSLNASDKESKLSNSSISSSRSKQMNPSNISFNLSDIEFEDLDNVDELGTNLSSISPLSDNESENEIEQLLKEFEEPESDPDEEKPSNEELDESSRLLAEEEKEIADAQIAIAYVEKKIDQAKALINTAETEEKIFPSVLETAKSIAADAHLTGENSDLKSTLKQYTKAHTLANNISERYQAAAKLYQEAVDTLTPYQALVATSAKMMLNDCEREKKDCEQHVKTAEEHKTAISTRLEKDTALMKKLDALDSIILQLNRASPIPHNQAAWSDVNVTSLISALQAFNSKRQAAEEKTKLLIKDEIPNTRIQRAETALTTADKNIKDTQLLLVTSQKIKEAHNLLRDAKELTEATVLKKRGKPDYDAQIKNQLGAKTKASAATLAYQEAIQALQSLTTDGQQKFTVGRLTFSTNSLHESFNQAFMLIHSCNTKIEEIYKKEDIADDTKEAEQANAATRYKIKQQQDTLKKAIRAVEYAAKIASKADALVANAKTEEKEFAEKQKTARQLIATSDKPGTHADYVKALAAIRAANELAQSINKKYHDAAVLYQDAHERAISHRNSISGAQESAVLYDTSKKAAAERATHFHDQRILESRITEPKIETIKQTMEHERKASIAHVENDQKPADPSDVLLVESSNPIDPTEEKLLTSPTDSMTPTDQKSIDAFEANNSEEDTDFNVVEAQDSANEASADNQTPSATASSLITEENSTEKQIKQEQRLNQNEGDEFTVVHAGDTTEDNLPPVQNNIPDVTPLASTSTAASDNQIGNENKEEKEPDLPASPAGTPLATEQNSQTNSVPAPSSPAPSPTLGNSVTENFSIPSSTIDNISAQFPTAFADNVEFFLKDEYTTAGKGFSELAKQILEHCEKNQLVGANGIIGESGLNHLYNMSLHQSEICDTLIETETKIKSLATEPKSVETLSKQIKEYRHMTVTLEDLIAPINPKKDLVDPQIQTHLQETVNVLNSSITEKDKELKDLQQKELDEHHVTAKALDKEIMAYNLLFKTTSGTEPQPAPPALSEAEKKYNEFSTKRDTLITAIEKIADHSAHAISKTMVDVGVHLGVLNENINKLKPTSTPNPTPTPSPTVTPTTTPANNLAELLAKINRELGLRKPPHDASFGVTISNINKNLGGLLEEVVNAKAAGIGHEKELNNAVYDLANKRPSVNTIASCLNRHLAELEKFKHEADAQPYLALQETTANIQSTAMFWQTGSIAAICDNNANKQDWFNDTLKTSVQFTSAAEVSLHGSGTQKLMVGLKENEQRLIIDFIGKPKPVSVGVPDAEAQARDNLVATAALRSVRTDAAHGFVSTIERFPSHLDAVELLTSKLLEHPNIAALTPDQQKSLKSMVNNFIHENRKQDITVDNLKDFIQKSVGPVIGDSKFNRVSTNLAKELNKAWNDNMRGPDLLELVIKQTEDYIKSQGGIKVDAKGLHMPDMIIPGASTKAFTECQIYYFKKQGYFSASNVNNASGVELSDKRYKELDALYTKHAMDRFAKPTLSSIATPAVVANNTVVNNSVLDQAKTSAQVSAPLAASSTASIASKTASPLSSTSASPELSINTEQDSLAGTPLSSTKNAANASEEKEEEENKAQENQQEENEPEQQHRGPSMLS